ncbi:MAG: hypothetical protein Kow00127_08510 [Bacteroidales bacterium]
MRHEIFQEIAESRKRYFEEMRSLQKDTITADKNDHPVYREPLEKSKAGRINTPTFIKGLTSAVRLPDVRRIPSFGDKRMVFVEKGAAMLLNAEEKLSEWGEWFFDLKEPTVDPNRSRDAAETGNGNIDTGQDNTPDPLYHAGWITRLFVWLKIYLLLDEVQELNLWKSFRKTAGAIHEKVSPEFIKPIRKAKGYLIRIKTQIAGISSGRPVLRWLTPAVLRQWLL